MRWVCKKCGWASTAGYPPVYCPKCKIMAEEVFVGEDE